MAKGELLNLEAIEDMSVGDLYATTAAQANRAIDTITEPMRNGVLRVHSGWRGDNDMLHTAVDLRRPNGHRLTRQRLLKRWASVPKVGGLMSQTSGLIERTTALFVPGASLEQYTPDSEVRINGGWKARDPAVTKLDPSLYLKDLDQPHKLALVSSSVAIMAGAAVITQICAGEAPRDAMASYDGLTQVRATVPSNV